MPEAKRVQFDAALSKAEKRGGRPEKAKPPLRDRIPQLPPMERLSPEQLQDADTRAVACVNLKLNGAPFHEIAKELGYASAESARQAYYSALASMHPPEDIETLRQMEGMRAETLFRASLAKASATHFVAQEIDPETGQMVEVRIANTDQLKWHEQAGKDLALHAAITGAKAPARMEVNATTEEINRVVHLIVEARGEQDVEADIWQMSEIEAIDAEVEED